MEQYLDGLTCMVHSCLLHRTSLGCITKFGSCHACMLITVFIISVIIVCTTLNTNDTSFNVNSVFDVIMDIHPIDGVFALLTLVLHCFR